MHLTLQCTLFKCHFFCHTFSGSSRHFCLDILQKETSKTSYVLIFFIHLLLIPVPAREIRLNNGVQKQILIEKFEYIEWCPNKTCAAHMFQKAKNLFSIDDKMPSHDTVHVVCVWVCVYVLYKCINDSQSVQLTFYNRTFFSSQSLFRRHFATDGTKQKHIYIKINL